MTTNYVDAIDSMRGLLNTVWNDDAVLNLIGYVPRIYWPGVEEPEKPDLDKFFARFNSQTVAEPQTTLRNGDNRQRYTSSGFLVVQIFAPRLDTRDRPMEKLRSLASLVKNTFRGHTDADNIWFRNSRIKELPPEDNFYNFNVIAEYQYDEVG